VADGFSSFTQANKMSTNHTAAVSTGTNHSHSSEPLTNHVVAESVVTNHSHTSVPAAIVPAAAAAKHLPYVGHGIYCVLLMVPTVRESQGI